MGIVHRPEQKDKGAPAAIDRVDEREQLVNLRESGPVDRVSLPEDLVTVIHAMMADIDTKLIAPALIPDGEGPAAVRLYKAHVSEWLDRDPVLRDAEVRFSGGGLHVLVWLEPAVELLHAGDRQRWRGTIAAVQSILPSDPTAPVLTALTRSVGSTNSKTSETVRTLRPGKPVTPDAFRDLYGRARSKPFATVARLLFGSERVSPCPICKVDGRTLLAGDRVGSCYGGCGKVALEQLLGTVLAPPAAKGV